MLHFHRLDDGKPLPRHYAFADDGEKFGAWPKTFDHVYTHGWLSRFCDMVRDNADWLEPTTFADNIRDVIDASVRDELDGRSVTTLSRKDRLEIVRALDARGVFNVKRAVGQVAAVLGVSRTTAYSCLQTIREEAVGGVRAGGPRRGGPFAADRCR